MMDEPRGRYHTTLPLGWLGQVAVLERRGRRNNASPEPVAAACGSEHWLASRPAPALGGPPQQRGPIPGVIADPPICAADHSATGPAAVLLLRHGHHACAVHTQRPRAGPARRECALRPPARSAVVTWLAPQALTRTRSRTPGSFCRIAGETSRSASGCSKCACQRRCGLPPPLRCGAAPFSLLATRRLTRPPPPMTTHTGAVARRSPGRGQRNHVALHYGGARHRRAAARGQLAP